MTNSTMHKIFMDNVQTIKNTQISNGEFNPDNEIYGKNIGTNFHTMSNYSGFSSRYINGMYAAQNTYKKYERITNILTDTKENEELYKDKILKVEAISTKLLKLEKLSL